MKTLILNHKSVILILVTSLLTYGMSSIGYGQVCNVGDILSPGESCTYPGTNIEFSVLNNGSGRFLFFTAGTGINARNVTINGVRYNFAASKQSDGTWLIEAVGDGGGQTPPPVQKPDLVVEQPRVSKSTLVPGERFTLSATVTNDGSGRAAVTTLRYYRSTDATITSLDTEVGTDRVSGLSASGSSAESISLTAPNTAGTYYYGACVDLVADESSSDNNCSTAVSITVQQITDSTPPASGTTYGVGEDIPTLPTGSWQADAVLGSGGFTQFVVSAGQTTITFGNGGAIRKDGITYTCVAAGGCEIEGRRVTQGTIQASGGGQTPPSVQKPDLVIESVEAQPSTVDPGQMFRLYATLRNSGTEASAATTIRYYQSTDGTISTTDTQIGTGRRNPLTANASIRRFLHVTAPTTPGIYYYGVCVDSVPNESDTNNNCSAAVSVTVSSQTTTPGTGMLSASTTTPLTEATLHESVVTLTLTDKNYERSKIDIGDALTVSGIEGVTIGTFGPAWFGVDRVSDTQITVELGFNGNIDTDAILTFTLGADAIQDYNGPALTVQVPVTAVIESIVLETDAPLTEATLHESVVTLTLTDKNYERSKIDIGDALTVSGIEGVTIGTFGPAWFGVDRVSDTQITVELGFNGNIDTDAILTFTLGADAIQNYNGPALTVQVPVAASTEWIVASTTRPLTKTTLDGSVITLTLSGIVYEWRSFDLRDAVTVSGIEGVTIDTFGVDRVSDAQVAIELNFDGKIEPIGTLTFTIEAGAIANYDGPALTAQLSVPTQLEEGEDGDVNGDGTVSIQDLMLVASSFGQTGQHPADINGDGSVDVKDLIVVAGVLDPAAAAPSLQPHSYEGLNAADVRRWLSEAAGFNLTDATSQQGILFLENLLMVLSPRETILLANYPNPFNPETWIPYHLANDSDVLLSIYDINGVLVRELDLGHQQAGYYTDRSRAVYWDGHNEWGEQVASGVYFYQLRAGDYSQMRKMVILK